LLGDYRTDPVPAAMRGGLVQLLAWLCSSSGVNPRKSGFLVDRVLANICSHRDANGACNISTTCPGDSLYALLPGLRESTWSTLPEYGEAFTAHNTPGAMIGGLAYTVQLTFSNRGRLSWDPNGANPFRLGYRWFRANGTPYEPPLGDVIRTPLPRVIEMGDQLSLGARVVAPREAGSFTLHWDIVREQVTWLEEKGAAALVIPVTVSAPVTPRLMLPALRRKP
jgi:hypothetical protein